MFFFDKNPSANGTPIRLPNNLAREIMDSKNSGLEI
jgi:hypothetical protein